MIVTDNAIFATALIISLIICGGVFFNLKRKRSFEGSREIWTLCFLVFVAVSFGFDWILRLPLKTIVLIECSIDDESFTHHTNLVYGNKMIKTYNGDELSIKDLNLKCGGIYGINLSESDMLFYATSYTLTEGFFAFNREKEPELPESLLLGPGEYAEIEAEPDFWFTNPLQSIEMTRGFWGQLWDSMFNVNYIKWTVVPYAEQ